MLTISCACWGRETPLRFRNAQDSEIAAREDRKAAASGAVLVKAGGDEEDLFAAGSQQISVVATHDLEAAAGGELCATYVGCL